MTCNKELLLVCDSPITSEPQGLKMGPQKFKVGPWGLKTGPVCLRLKAASDSENGILEVEHGLVAGQQNKIVGYPTCHPSIVNSRSRISFHGEERICARSSMPPQ